MKTLLILRHAKSSHDDASLSDHDRPLNARGRRDAKRIGRLLDREELWPDRILSSTATRAATTVRGAVAASERPADREATIEYDGELYAFDGGSYLDAIARLADGASSLMIVGHNPGLENLVGYLSGRYVTFPTAALAHIRLAVDAWDDLDRGAGELANLWLPRELEG